VNDQIKSQSNVMQTIRMVEKTGKDGTLSLRIPMGKPEAEYEVLVVVQPRAPATDAEERSWPAGYLDRTFGSIDDETFLRPPHGQRSRP
jgi:hypothetical protein